MATLGQILEEIKLGKEIAEAKYTAEEISTLIDEDYNIFLHSKRIRAFLKEEAELSDEKNFRKLNSIAKHFEDYENKIFEETKVSSVYSRMKADSVYDTIKPIYEELIQNKKVSRKFNKDTFKKIFATIEEGYEELSKQAKIKPKKLPELPNYFRNYIKEDKKVIQEALAE